MANFGLPEVNKGMHNLLKKKIGGLTGSLLVMALFSACEEVVNPELVSVPPVLVIDAFVTDVPGQSYVKLTTTAPFSSPDPVPLVSGALVTISDSEGLIDVFRENSPGMYRPADSGFAGKIGRQYRLDVEVDNQDYTARSPLLPAPRVDSVTLRRRQNELFFTDGYYLVAHYQDPPSADNFYLWQSQVNGRQVNSNIIVLTTDENLNGLYLNQELPEPLPLNTVARGDTLQLELFSLSRTAFEYFQGLSQLTESGSPAQAVPENPVSNIQGGGIGFFTASAVKYARVIVAD